MKKLENTFARFVCYAIVGWLYEAALWIFEQRQFMNRGFCFGPWLPIYGFGGIIIYHMLYKYAKRPLKIGEIDAKPVLVCAIISAMAAVVELISTYAMDMAGLDFHTLWSYDEYVINFQERIALLPAIKFGILGCIIVYLAQGKIDMFIGSENKRVVLAKRLMMACFVADVVVHLINGSNYTNVPVFYF